MATTGLRELRQQASELVRQAEAGEVFTITVSGRPVAELGPVRSRRWRSGHELKALFASPADRVEDEWAADREKLDGLLVEPPA